MKFFTERYLSKAQCFSFGLWLSLIWLLPTVFWVSLGFIVGGASFLISTYIIDKYETRNR